VVSDKDEIVLLYVLFPNLKEATQVSKALLKDKLIICSNITPGVLSIYEEDGIEKEKPEAKVMLKAFKSKVDLLKKTIDDTHSYKYPIVLEIDIASINEKMRENLNN